MTPLVPPTEVRLALISRLEFRLCRTNLLSLSGETIQEPSHA
jgi:hypothetical protein